MAAAFIGTVLATAMAAGESFADVPSLGSSPLPPSPSPSGRDTAIRIGPVPFAAGSSSLSKDAKAGLDKFVAWLKANPDRKVTLEGHSDDPGTDEYTLAVGEKRANNVRAYMVASGIDASRLTTVSYGRFRPLSSAGGKSSRVEMVVGE
jgi:peptidoglycan-associated lipoprotein